MRVVLSTISKFHMFDLARQLQRLGVLERLFTARPHWKMRDEGLPVNKVSTFPVFQTLFEGMGRLGFYEYPLQEELRLLCHQSLDRYVALRLPPCDIFDALVYSGLHSGRRAQKAGARWVCDCPTAHASVHESLVTEEYQRVGIPYTAKRQQLIDYELQSYAEADLLLVASSFAKRTFVSGGIDCARVRVVPYGADLSRFSPLPRTPHDGINVLFVGQLTVRKGLHDLLSACQLVGVPLNLTLVGSKESETTSLLERHGPVRPQVVGAVPKSVLPKYYSAADVLVLPSVSDGFGMVVAEAFACGCPVLVTENVGSADVVIDGVNGFIVPIRSPQELADRLAWLCDHPLEREAMRVAAFDTVRTIGGWNMYGDGMVDAYEALLKGTSGAA